MTMQRLCHSRTGLNLLTASLCCFAGWAHASPPAHDYPTQARVEYVNDCVARNGGKLAALYQCSCAIDRIAQRLSFEEFTEASTFAKYAKLPGEGGALFRDSEQAQQQASLYREVETAAFQACGLDP